jgi:hypothetical protein
MAMSERNFRMLCLLLMALCVCTPTRWIAEFAALTHLITFGFAYRIKVCLTRLDFTM